MQPPPQQIHLITFKGDRSKKTYSILNLFYFTRKIFDFFNSIYISKFRHLLYNIFRKILFVLRKILNFFFFFCFFKSKCYMYLYQLRQFRFMNRYQLYICQQTSLFCIIPLLYKTIFNLSVLCFNQTPDFIKVLIIFIFHFDESVACFSV